jgi:hypothetical protein
MTPPDQSKIFADLLRMARVAMPRTSLSKTYASVAASICSRIREPNHPLKSHAQLLGQPHRAEEWKPPFYRHEP